jgi:hypothetical protein
LEGEFMSWQDELAQLDSALASGQISADEYRTRRDRVIAQASGQSTPEQPQQPQQGGEPTTVFRPITPPQGQPGFGDRTQAVGGDRTQVVGQGQGQGDADSTQIVPNMPQFPPPQAPPPWETHQPQAPNMTPPPWANEELPPEFGQQSWPRQGPEVFEEKSSGGGGKTVGIIVAVVLVLALAGGAVWFFGFRDSGGDNNQAGNGGDTSQTENAPTTTTPPPPDIPDGPFIELPGNEVLNTTVPMQEALANNMPTEQEAQLLASVGVSEVGALVTEDEDGLRRGIWAFKIGEGGDPAAVLQAIDQLYQAAQYELLSDQNGVLSRKKAPTPPEELTAFRAHYITDGYVVRVEVYSKDSANAEAEYQDLLTQETDEFPPAS